MIPTTLGIAQPPVSKTHSSISNVLIGAHIHTFTHSFDTAWCHWTPCDLPSNCKDSNRVSMVPGSSSANLSLLAGGSIIKPIQTKSSPPDERAWQKLSASSMANPLKPAGCMHNTKLAHRSKKDCSLRR